MLTPRRTATVLTTLGAVALTLVATVAAAPHRAAANANDTIADVAVAAKDGVALIEPAELALSDAQNVMRRMSTDEQFQKQLLALAEKKDVAGVQALVQKLAPNSTVTVEKIQDFFLALAFHVRGHAVADDESGIENPDDRPPTLACSATTLTCQMQVYSSGTVALVALVNGSEEAVSAHILVEYECPPNLPTNFAGSPAEIPITTTAVEIWPFPGEPLGEDLVTVYAPFTYIGYAGLTSIGIPKGWYSPGRGHDEYGRILVPEVSKVLMECRSWQKWSDSEEQYVWQGRVMYAKHAGLRLWRPNIQN